MMSDDTHNATSLPGLVVGRSRSSSQGGQLMLPFGLDHAPASHLVQPENEKEQTTRDICGPTSDGLLTSADLQQSLANRLRQNLDGTGSPLYDLTWKQWDMLSGLPICAQRASARRTSAKDCSGWPTAAYSDATRGGQMTDRMTGQSLVQVANTTGWSTPMAGSPATETYNAAGNNDFSRKVVDLAGWSTPSSRDHKDTPGMATEAINPDGTIRNRNDQLPRQAVPAGWPTPVSTNGNKGACTTEGAMRELERKGHLDTLPTMVAISRTTSSSSSAGTANRGQLNPEFVCWLQGFPAEWLWNAPLIKPVRKSTKHTGIPE